jgi:hypothetical protein
MTARVLRFPFTAARIGAGRKARVRPSVSIALSEKPGTGQSYIVTATALTIDGVSLVGRVQTNPLETGQALSRVVLIACCPGARAWEVRVKPVDSALPVGGWLSVDESPDLGSEAAIPCNGSLLLQGGPDAGRYNQDSAAAAGATVIPSGARVRGYSVIAGAAAATITIGSLSPITVPAGGAFGDTPDNLVGPVTITFGGDVASRWASWLELG